MPCRPRVFVSRAIYHAHWQAARGDAVFSDPREAAAPVGVEVYGLRVKKLPVHMRMNPGSSSRVLARASQRARKDASFYEQRLALEERLAELGVSCGSSKEMRW